VGLGADAVNHGEHLPLDRRAGPEQQPEQERSEHPKQRVAPGRLTNALLFDHYNLARGDLLVRHLNNLFARPLTHDLDLLLA